MLMTELALFLSISQAVFLAIAAFMFQRKTYVGKLLIVFAFSMFAYFCLILMSPDLTPWEGYFLARVSYLIPGVIWLLAFALFQHEKPVPLYAWVLIAAYFCLKATGAAWYIIDPEGFTLGPLHTATFIVPQLINIGIYIHTLGLVVLEYRQDLIEERRSLRVPFVAVLGTFWLLVAIDVSFSVLWDMGYESIAASQAFIKDLRSILSFPVILALNLILFRINTIGFGMTAPLFSRQRSVSEATDVFDSKDLALKEKLLKLMETEKVYCQAGLTIGELANRMNVQEHKLRSVINRVLKFNNFSHFLNKYRIHEAETRLLNTDDSIFSIGIDIGYTSLSSFHKAFKETHGTTPKEYRILNRRPELTADKKNPVLA